MKILIVCSSNICRSPYVEFLLKRIVKNDPLLSKNIKWVKSAAVFHQTKRTTHVFPKNRVRLKEKGFTDEEIDTHIPLFYPKVKDRFKEADIIIGMTYTHKWETPCKYWKKFKTLSQITDGKYIPIPDPWLKKTQEEYNKEMDKLDIYIEKLANVLRERFKEQE